MAVSASKKRMFFAIMLLFVLIAIEGISYFAAMYLRRKGVLYSPIAASSYGEYLAERDDVLGWPAPASFETDGRFDLSGSRIIPAYPDPNFHDERVSLYGDSFTYANDVSNEHAWSNGLSKKLGCRVSNYGVGGYGSDQAYLRFHENVRDKSKIVFLNHLSENIIRNVNQFRGLLYFGNPNGFKPRFIVGEDGKLVLIPLPTLSQEEYKKFVQNPTSEYLPHEYFLPGGDSGNSMLGFPYSLSVIRAISHFHIQAKLASEPWYMDFYQEDHLSQALDVTEKILVRFYQEAQERGKVPVVTVIPTGLDLVWFEEHQVWVYQNLLDRLSKRNIPVLNYGESIMQRLGDRDPCSLFRTCNSHFNEEGYEMLADISYEYLKANDLIRLTTDQAK